MFYVLLICVEYAVAPGHPKRSPERGRQREKEHAKLRWGRRANLSYASDIMRAMSRVAGGRPYVGGKEFSHHRPILGSYR
jgi:hypothetical protein